MDTLGIQKANLHGTSAVGFVALQFAARYPERVGKLAMVGCIARYDTALRLGRKLSKELALNVGMDSAAEMTAQQVLTRNFLDSPQSEAFLENMRATFRATPVDTYVKMMRPQRSLTVGRNCSASQRPRWWWRVSFRRCRRWIRAHLASEVVASLKACRTAGLRLSQTVATWCSWNDSRKSVTSLWDF